MGIDEQDDDWEFDVDKVKALEKLENRGNAEVGAMWVIYENALNTGTACMYLGAANGLVYLTIPTDKTIYVGDFVSGSY